MRNAPVQIMCLLALSLPMNLLGCATPTPTPPAPEAPRPMTPEGGIAPSMPAPMTAPSLSVPSTNGGNGAMAAPIPQTQTPPSASTVTPPQAPGPIQPQQSPIDYNQIMANVPQQIPADQAAGQLYSLNASQLANVQYPTTPFAGTTGYSYGAIPNMFNYGVYNNCLYYPYQGVLIPYTLQGNCYYPYAYSSPINPYWSGYYAYPFLTYSAGCYYPYFYYCNQYLFGFADWEYYWPVFRARHHGYDWKRWGSHRRSATGNFRNWRDRVSGGEGGGSGGAGGNFQPRGSRVVPAGPAPDAAPVQVTAADAVIEESAPQRPNRRRHRTRDRRRD